MGTWNSRGLRGSTLEDLINRTNEKYLENGLALIQKIPTPITPVKIDKENGNISLAYFEKDSTVDYIGVIQGVPVCFDAKECTADTFPMHNIHEHQFAFMTEFEKQGGISFLSPSSASLSIILSLSETIAISLIAKNALTRINTNNKTMLKKRGVHMLSKPEHGWTDFSLGESCYCLSYLSNIPLSSSLVFWSMKPSCIPATTMVIL